MKRSSSLFAPAAFVLAALMMCLSGCVVHDHGGYAEGYREGYYDREHNRYWHEQAWHDCVADDPHCH